MRSWIYNRGQWDDKELNGENEWIAEAIDKPASFDCGIFAATLYEQPGRRTSPYPFCIHLEVVPDSGQRMPGDGLIDEEVYFPDLPSLLMFLKEYGGKTK